jgi:hypothetical protein
VRCVIACCACSLSASKEQSIFRWIRRDRTGTNGIARLSDFAGRNREFVLTATAVYDLALDLFSAQRGSCPDALLEIYAGIYRRC